MRYFTRSWHEESDDDQAEEVRHTYLRRLDEIEPTLTPELTLLARKISLHDCLFREFVYDEVSKLLRLRLRCGDLKVGYFDLELRYGGATLLAGYTPELVAAVRASKTEVLYDEVGLAGEGEFDHRMLLWPREEMTIRFRSFSLSRTLATGRHDP